MSASLAAGGGGGGGGGGPFFAPLLRLLVSHSAADPLSPAPLLPSPRAPAPRSYLKVSISDFLTLFAARTRSWFFQRRLGWLLGGAACIAMATSTLLSLFWDKIFSGLGPSAYMQGLRFSNGSCLTVWIYCIVW